MHYLKGASDHWKGEHTMCCSLSIVPVAMLFGGPAEMKLMHVYRRQYAQAYPPGGPSESDLQRGCYGSQEESNGVLESHDWPTASLTSEKRMVASIILSIVAIEA